MNKINYFIVDSLPNNAVLFGDCWYCFPYRYKSICDSNGVFLGYIRERVSMNSSVWSIIEHINTYGHSGDFTLDCFLVEFCDDDLPF